MKEQYPLHESMRGYFGYELYKAMSEDDSIWLLAADLGYGMLDMHQKDHPDRFINTGASEASMMAMAAGLAQENQRPFTYTISSFYMRAAEPIHLYIAREKLPVVMLGSGRDQDYAHDGPSHDAHITQKYMNMIGIKSLYPENKEEMSGVMNYLRNVREPIFLSLRR